jgi:hypothetical protein
MPSHPEGITPLLSKTFNDRGQMDLIDMQSNIYDGMTWILHYQDHLTKFSYIRPLQNKQVNTKKKKIYGSSQVTGLPGRLPTGRPVRRLRRPICRLVRSTHCSREPTMVNAECHSAEWLGRSRTSNLRIGVPVGRLAGQSVDWYVLLVGMQPNGSNSSHRGWGSSWAGLKLFPM